MSLIVSISGIRGVVGESLTADVAREYGAAYGTFLSGGLVVVGRDSRLSGPTLKSAIVEGLVRCGCPVIDLGIASTPGTALMVRRHGAAGGIVVTASHNPPQWNGIKFLTHEGLAPPVEHAKQIWAIRDFGEFGYVSKDRAGYVTEDPTCHEHHATAVLKIVEPETISRRRLKVVLDSNSGAGGLEGRVLLESLDCDVVMLNGEPDGIFPHPAEPLAEHLGGLCEAVRRHGADVGFAQDPDADRLAVVDERGVYIGEEYTLALSAKYLFEHRPGACATNMSTSRMIDDLALQAGPPCRVYRTAVGEANVVDCIKKNSCVFGGEGNGGVIDPRVVPVRDSLVGMALVLQLLADEAKPLSNVAAEIPRYHMIKRKFECSQEGIVPVVERLKEAFKNERINDLDGVRIDWPDGWVHVRGSNTEPVVRVIAEGTSQQTTEKLISRVLQIIGN